MAIARTKMMIHDDVLRPAPRAYIRYEGPNPQKFYKLIPRLLASVFRTQSGQVQEKDLSWSKGDPEKFKVTWEVDKDIDRYSYYMVVVKIEGSSSQNIGKIMIEIEGALRTEYPQETIWEKSLLYEFLRMLWHRSFYNSKRDEYLREGRRLLGMFQEDLKKITHENT